MIVYFKGVFVYVGTLLFITLQFYIDNLGIQSVCLTVCGWNCKYLIYEIVLITAVDSENLMPPGADEIKDGQWLGVTVRSMGPGKKVMVSIL